MENAPTTQGIFIGKVVRQSSPCDHHFACTLDVHGFPQATPGQFMQIQCRSPSVTVQQCERAEGRLVSIAGASFAVGPREAFLRRPMSIAGLRRTGELCEVDLLGRVMGNGTEWLADRRVGDLVNFIGPLGRGFSTLSQGTRALLVAGGVGLPPIRWLGENLRKRGVTCDAVYGARTRELMPVKLLREPSREGEMAPCIEEFSREGINAAITTDDGTCGMKGHVVAAVRRYFDVVDASAVSVYACGPEPMLRSLGAFCVDRGLPCEVALERMMACGMGTCQSCVVRVVDKTVASEWRYALACTDGPVFDAAELVWE